MTIFDLAYADVVQRLQRLRTHYCTGPCGQSSGVMETRAETDAIINAAIREIQMLRKLLDAEREKRKNEAK